MHSRFGIGAMWVASVGVAGCAGILLGLSLSDDEDRSVPSAVKVVDEAHTGAQVGDHLESSSRPQSRTEIQVAETPEATPAESPPTAVEPAGAGVGEALGRLEETLFDKNPPFDGTDAWFKEKYAGLSPSQMKQAFILVRDRYDIESREIGTRRMADGLYEQWVMGEADKLPLTPSKGGLPRSFGFSSQSNSDGTKTVKIADIPGDEYPEFERLGIEQWWLHNQLHKLDACDCKNRVSVQTFKK